jgi:hypothetical protein
LLLLWAILDFGSVVEIYNSNNFDAYLMETTRTYDNAAGAAMGMYPPIAFVILCFCFLVNVGGYLLWHFLLRSPRIRVGWKRLLYGLFLVFTAWNVWSSLHSVVDDWHWKFYLSIVADLVWPAVLLLTLYKFWTLLRKTA